MTMRSPGWAGGSMRLDMDNAFKNENNQTRVFTLVEKEKKKIT